MKKIISLIIIFVVILLSFFNVKNLSLVINSSNISPTYLSCVEGGEIMYFECNQLDDIISSLDLEIHSKQDISDRIIIEGYSQKLSDYVLINNLKTNIQIAIDDEKIIVGYPLIKESF